MVDTAPLKAANAKRWANAKVTRDVSAIAKRLVASKARYQAVEAKTGVPWFVIAVIHMRESSQNWGSSLAQGDPINRVSTHVPRGRGPFPTWEAAAIDALVDCGPYLARNKDWSIGGTLARLEEYNGLGYYRKGKPSPYVWAGTNQYTAGKYVADGVYDPNHVDTQPGCAGLILAMMAIDPSIKMGEALPVPAKPVSTGQKTAAGTGGAVVVAGTVAAGVHQGWPVSHWLIAAGIGLVVGAAIYLIVKSRKASQ